MPKGFRTVAVNAVAIAVPAVGFILENPVIVGALTGPSAPLWISALGVVNIILRALTDTPMFKAQSTEMPDRAAP